MTKLPEQAQRVIELVNEQHITHLDLQFTDVTGMVKAVQIPSRQLEHAFTEGSWFDGSALEGFARVAESDMYLRPDPNTFAVLPWELGDKKVGRLICDVYTPAGEPFAGDPRDVLRRALALAQQMNFRYVVSPELEFFLFKEPITSEKLATVDHFGYFDVSDTESRKVRREITDALESMGVMVDSAHHEVGGGQHELDFAPMDVLQAADAVMTARFAAKSIAAANGMYATFMPKPLARVPGSGMHIHQTLIDTFTNQNAFGDSNTHYHLSNVGRSFIAGQLVHARGMCAVLAPLVNSYKRLVAGLEAPVYIIWAQLNRAALLRVPRTNADQIDQVRVELRCVDPSCNPYLAFAVMLRSGLDGISQAMELPNPAEEDLFSFDTRRHKLPTLPNSLGEALNDLEQSDLVNDALGLHAYERFVSAKRIEWNEYVLSVSPWELDRYLKIY
ncbi:MAG: type I glutamate--ammonia ligase [Anaerolineae bacterium]|nr:type I glutamate--ammonia ligase [Anaerolineae bacterium]